ncbi:MAG: HlyD family efflux transporter periplasmic adaptor subunit [Planctomycetota bacterium]|nr:MAG: HlyD family efflux transporter periplasmic adaptor subunit [Planctomycetota bacterium]
MSGNSSAPSRIAGPSMQHPPTACNGRPPLRNAVTSIVAVLTIGWLAPTGNGWSADIELQWRTFEDCPVQVETIVSVPALESGQIQSIAVERNAAVQRGTVVAQLDAAVVESEVALAEAQYADAQLTAADTSDVDHQQLVVDELRDELQKHLAIGGSVSESEIRSRKLAVKKAEIALHHAQRALEHARLNLRLVEARWQVARLRLDRHTIRTPVSGIVVRIHKQPGEWIETGEPLVEIHDLSRLVVDWIVPVGQVDMARLIGAPVTVQLPGATMSAPIRGQIVSYDHRVSAQGVVRVHARVANVQHQGHWVLLPGMSVQLRVGLPARSVPQEDDHAAEVTTITPEQQPDTEHPAAVPPISASID